MNIVKKAQDVLGPWSDFFDIDRFFGKEWDTKMQSIPSVNIKETENGYIIELAVAGMAKNDFKINIDEDVLTISAEKKEEKKEGDEKYTRREYSYNSFSRSFSLPQNADADKAQAGYDNGVLTISLPKKTIEPVKKGKEISIS